MSDVFHYQKLTILKTRFAFTKFTYDAYAGHDSFLTNT